MNKTGWKKLVIQAVTDEKQLKQIFAINTKAAGATIEQAAEAMKKVINIPYTPKVFKTDKNNNHD